MDHYGALHSGSIVVTGTPQIPAVPPDFPDRTGRRRVNAREREIARGGSLMSVRRLLPVILLVLAFAGVSAVIATPPVNAVVTTVAAMCAATACLVRAGRRRGRTRWSWAGLGLGALACGLVGGTPTAPAPGLLVLVVAAGALFLVPIPARAVADRIRGVVDTLLIAVSLTALSYHLVLGNGRPGVPLIYPVADIALATVGVAAVLRLRRGVP